MNLLNKALHADGNENGIELSLIEIPEIIQRIYPKMTKRDYLQALDDQEFLKRTTPICVPWYLDFTSNLIPKNFVAELEYEKSKENTQLGKLTIPKEFNFSMKETKTQGINIVLHYIVTNTTWTELLPLFSKGPFFDVEEKPKSKRRLNSSRINELSKETRRHKLSKDLIGLPMRLMNSKPPKELPLDKEEIRRNYKQWIEKQVVIPN